MERLQTWYWCFLFMCFIKLHFTSKNWVFRLTNGSLLRGPLRKRSGFTANCAKIIKNWRERELDQRPVYTNWNQYKRQKFWLNSIVTAIGIGGSRGRHERRHHGRLNPFNCIQFLGTFGKIVCWRLSSPVVGASHLGKSWIRC